MGGLTLNSSERPWPLAALATVRPMPATINSLQAGRAGAAMLVVLFHASASIFFLPKYWGVKPFGRLFDFGASGVVFFFVLSGFIILQVHYADLNRPQRIGAYLWKRFRRVYPIYWLVLLAALPIYFALPNTGLSGAKQPVVILSSVLLVHLTSNPKMLVLDIAWTLFHEVLFYGMFAIAMWRARVGMTVMAVWFAACLFAAAAIPYVHANPPFYLSPFNVMFGLGMAASWWMRRQTVPKPLACAVAGIVIYLLAGAYQDYSGGETGEGALSLVYGIGTMLTVLGAVELERSGRLAVPGWLRLLGDASYAIYLVHFLALSMLAKVFWASGLARLLPTPVAFAALVVLATLAGVLCHLLVERPLLGLLRRKPARTAAIAGSRV